MRKSDLLRGLTAVGQANTEFIVAHVAATSWVLLVDQHAAHERTRLESLLADELIPRSLWGGDGPRVVRTAVLSPPWVFVASQVSKSRIARFSSALQSWGIRISFPPSQGGGGGGGGNVAVCSLPAILRDKSRGVVWDGILNYVGSLVGTPASTHTPQILVDAFNSAACHSAVRFGDVLSLEQQQHILDDLVTCALPFQCAHGRPTMIPLVRATARATERSVQSDEQRSQSEQRSA